MTPTNFLRPHLNATLDIFKTVVIEINKILTTDIGETHKVLNEGSLESALGQFYQGWYTEEQAIAAVYRSLILNHCFENGNKRTAYIVAMTLKMPEVSAKELETLTLQLAQSGGGKIQVNEIANTLYGTKYTD